MPIDRRRAVAVTLAALAAPGRAARADTPRRTRSAVTTAQFDRWLALRGGLGEPAYWYSEGLVRPMSESGRAVARMLGVETWVTPAALRTPTRAVSLSRKIFFLLEPERDELARDAAGGPARPSVFVFQLRTFTLEGGAIRYEVESHDLAGVRLGGRNSIYTITEIGDQLHVNYGTYPLRRQPDGTERTTSGEIYDYFDAGPRERSTPARFQMNWVGANLEGRIANMHGWRFDSFDEIPNAWLRATVRGRASEWTAPPRSLAEIEALRRQVPYRVAGLGL
jgi:hypothetical protein